MNCQEIQNRLPAFLEDMLSPEEKILIEKHLFSCAVCSGSLEDLKKTKALLTNLKDVEPPPFFEQRIMTRIREEAGREKGLWHRLFLPLNIKVPIQVLATVLIAVLAFYVYQKNESEMKPLESFPGPIPRYENDNNKGQPSPPPIVSSPMDAPAQRVPESSLPESGQQRFTPAPSPDYFGKGIQSGDYPRPNQEKILSPPGPPLPPALADREKEMTSPGTGFSSKDQGRFQKQEFGQKEERPLLELKEKEKKDVAALPADESRKSKSQPARPKSAVAVLKMAVEMDLTVQVGEVNTGIREIEEILGRTGARMTERQHHPGGEFLRIEIPAGKTALFLDRLESVGRMTPDKKPFPIPEGPATVNIKIIKRP
ncbi:MAG: DUF2275 domain-containing protein [Thermodesulfobacteriota bacterium]